MSVTDMLCWRHEIHFDAKFNKDFLLEKLLITNMANHQHHKFVTDTFGLQHRSVTNIDVSVTNRNQINFSKKVLYFTDIRYDFKKKHWYWNSTGDQVKVRDLSNARMSGFDPLIPN